MMTTTLSVLVHVPR